MTQEFYMRRTLPVTSIAAGRWSVVQFILLANTQVLLSLQWIVLYNKHLTKVMFHLGCI